jgi:hypothetical protein
MLLPYGKTTDDGNGNADVQALAWGGYRARPPVPEEGRHVLLLSTTTAPPARARARFSKRATLLSPRRIIHLFVREEPIWYVPQMRRLLFFPFF